MSEARRCRHARERGSGPVRVSAATSVVVTAVVVGLSVATGPGTSDPGAGGAEPDAGTTPSAPPEPAPVATSQLGQSRAGPNSDTTLLQVRKVLAPADRSAPPGKEWFGIRARTCMHADARASGQVPWSAWVVATEWGASYTGKRVAWGDFPPQQLTIAGIRPGECTVGWVLVEVPKATFKKVEQVSFRSRSGVSEWAV